MSDQSERLRRMTEYGWHMLRADSELAQAAQAEDEVVRSLHERLAALHRDAADDLSDAWRCFAVAAGDAREAQSWQSYETLFTALYGPEKLERVRALIPPALFG